MATTPAIPQDIVKNLQVGWTKEYKKSVIIVTETYIGDVGTINTVAAQHPVGGEYTPTGGSKSIITVSRTEKIQADQAKWIFAYGQDKTSSGHADDPIDEVWSCVVSQYQFPLEKYLSPEEAKAVREWENKEPSEQYSILESEKSVAPASRTTLPGKAYDVAKLKFQGTNEVIRCYPQATRVSTYDRYKSSIQPELNTIDTEPDDEFSWTGDNEMSWLKVQFDWEQQQDGTWTLTESWQGTPVKDGGWNSKLYDEWDFYKESEPQPNP